MRPVSYYLYDDYVMSLTTLPIQLNIYATNSMAWMIKNKSFFVLAWHGLY